MVGVVPAVIEDRVRVRFDVGEQELWSFRKARLDSINRADTNPSRSAVRRAWRELLPRCARSAT